MTRPLTTDLSEIDDEKIENYINEFKEIENKDCVKNIALMGTYGSGKSTILLKLKSLNPSKYININMIEFSEDSKAYLPQDDSSISNRNDEIVSSTIDNLDRKEKIERVEQSIIQQLIYQESQKNIPFSKFKRENPDKKSVFINISMLLLCLLSSILFFSFNCFNYIINFTNNAESWLSLLNFIFLLLDGTYLLSILIYYLYKNFKISKISLSKNSANIECEKYESVYNRFLDEIIYFFKETTYDTIILEDIDRYDDLLFFSHLRELNSLLNNSKYLNKKITFIYAIKDDLFIKQDKHKFFDYIIPVIPVLDYTNSFDKFKEYLPKNEISDNVLKLLSLYIKDLRTLKNICNEYDFYKKLNNVEIYKNENLLALLVFKNLYPSEFTKLQYNESIIDKIFSKKEEIINKIKEPKFNELDHLITALKDNEYCLDPQFTLLALIKDILENNQDIQNLSTNYNILNISGLATKISSTKEIFNSKISWDEFSNRTSLSVDATSSYYSYHKAFSIPISDYLQERIKQLVELHNIKDSIKSEYKQNIATKIDKLESELNLYTNIKANKLYEEKQDELDEILTKYKELNKEVIDNKFISLIKQLILEDLINESYSSYISLTYKTNKNENDITFIRNVYSNIENSFDLELNNIDAIYSELKNKLYDNKYVFNINIIKYFALKDKRKLNELLKINKAKLKMLYSNLDCNDELFNEISISMCNADQNILVIIGKENNKYKRDTWIKTIITLNNEIFNKLNIDFISSFIKNYDLIKFSKFNSTEIEKLIKNLKSANVKFSNISGIEQNKELYSAIINNKLFEFNFSNLKIINSDFNYSEITTNNNLKEYINDNITKFVNILINNNIRTKQSDEFNEYINEFLKDEELLCNYYIKNPIVIKKPTIIKNEKVCIALCKNNLNIIPFLKNLDLSEECIIEILKSLTKNFIKENANEIYNIIYSHNLFNTKLIQTHFYDYLIGSIENQTCKDFLLENLLPYINENNIDKIIKSYNEKFRNSKKEIIILCTNLNNILVEKLEEYNLYKLVKTENNYMFLEKLEKPPKLIT